MSSAARSPLCPTDSQGAPRPLLGSSAAGVPVYGSYRPTIKSLSNELELIHGDPADAARYVPVPAVSVTFLYDLPPSYTYRKITKLASLSSVRRTTTSCKSSCRNRWHADFAAPSGIFAKSSCPPRVLAPPPRLSCKWSCCCLGATGPLQLKRRTVLSLSVSKLSFLRQLSRTPQLPCFVWVFLWSALWSRPVGGRKGCFRFEILGGRPFLR